MFTTSRGKTPFKLTVSQEKQHENRKFRGPFVWFSLLYCIQLLISIFIAISAWTFLCLYVQLSGSLDILK